VPDFHGHRSLRPVNTTGRTANEAEHRRRSRNGDTAQDPSWRRGRSRLVWTETRNGLPDFRPYVYRGTGEDIYEDLYDDEEEAAS